VDAFGRGVERWCRHSYDWMWRVALDSAASRGVAFWNRCRGSSHTLLFGRFGTCPSCPPPPPAPASCPPSAAMTPRPSASSALRSIATACAFASTSAGSPAARTSSFLVIAPSSWCTAASGTDTSAARRARSRPQTVRGGWRSFGAIGRATGATSAACARQGGG
jgi:hypothetical protein